MRSIYWALDPPSKEEDESCRAGYSYNDDGEIIIEDIKYIKKKEDKKVKKEIDFKKIKYWDVKVVKVVKVEKEECHHDEVICKNGDFRCSYCGRYLERVWEKIIEGGRWSWGIKRKQRKGNWVNGENIDKIKFPCLCSFLIGGERVYGELDDCVNYNRQIICLKELVEQIGHLNIRMNRQRYYTEFPICDLGTIIRVKKINILKGKIILFEKE